MSTTTAECEETDEIDMDLEFVNADAETTCTICFAEFLEKSDLDIHVEQVHKSGLKPCHFCNENYSDLVSYAAHIRDNHFNEIRCCPYCSKVVKSVKHQNKHVRYSKSYFSCSECDGLFTNTRQLELHEIQEHPEGSDSFYLPCMPYLSSLLNFKASTALQDSANSFFFCTSCEFTSIDLKSYVQHISEEKCKSLICDRCSDLFRDKKNLIRHLEKRKTPCDNYEIVKCLNCKLELNYRQLRDHLISCQNLKCNHCTEEFDTVQQLSLHQQNTHPRAIQNATRCKFCQKVYVGDYMKKHIRRTHKPMFHLYKYMCQICEDIFIHPQKLFAHYFIHHKELQPYTCKLCDKKFRIRKQFTLHIKIQHKSVGFVEFDDQYLVYFTDKKSEKPFIPQCVINEEDYDLSISDNDNDIQAKSDKVLDESRTSDKDGPSRDDETKENEDEHEESSHLIERKIKRRTRRFKIQTKSKKIAREPMSSDDEPLLEVKKRSKKVKLINANIWKKGIKKRSHKFTCEKCFKYCYTLQNYKNHMSIHKKSDKITCVKCKQEFNNGAELEKHQQTEHSSSLLTETLKKVLEKRKTCDTTASDESSSQKFTKTIKKVKIEKTYEPATIKITNNNLSVKNFLETFTPEASEAHKLKIDAYLTIKKYDSPYYRDQLIKMHKFKEESNLNLNQPVKLKMPQKFQSILDFKPEISISILQQPHDHDYEISDLPFTEDEDRQIPDVAEEIMLEETAEETNIAPKVIIPQLPKGYPAIHVATLQSQAPFYKIVKVSESSKNRVKVEDTPPVRKDTIQLRDGTKLVSANPLAHLLGDKQVDEIVKSSKYYKYKPLTKGKDIEGILANALQKLVQKPVYKKKPSNTQNKRARRPAKKSQVSVNDSQELNNIQDSLNDSQEPSNMQASTNDLQGDIVLQETNNDSLETEDVLQQPNDSQELEQDIKFITEQLQESTNENDMQDLHDNLQESSNMQVSNIDMPVLNDENEEN